MHHGPELIRKAFRYRILPTPEQAAFFMRISGCGRLVYNEALERERKAHAAGQRIGYADHQKHLTDLKKAKPFLGEVPHHTLQAALRDLEQANERWRAGQTEAPTFRRHRETPHFRFPDPGQFRVARVPRADHRAGKITARGAATGKVRYLHAPKFGMRKTDLGPLQVIQHRPLKGKVKTCTITREGDHWYVSFSVEIRRRGTARHPRNPGTERLIATDPTLGEQPSKPGRKASKTHRADHRRMAAERKAKRNRSRKAQRDLVASRAAKQPALTPDETALLADLGVVGGDLGVANPITLSTGEMLGGAILSVREEKHLARLQRAVSRKQEALRARHGRDPGASLRGLEIPKALRQARAKVRRFWGKILRRRRDMIHKITTWLVATYDVVVLEDLAVGNMTASAKGDAETPGRNVSRKASLNRKILDRAWGEFKRQLAYKLAHASRRRGLKKILLRVDPAYTSQTCYRCKSKDSESRSSRSAFACTACGHVDHADINAARNIRERGLAEIACACGLALEDLPDVLLERPGLAVDGSRGHIETDGGSPVVTTPLVGHAPHLFPGIGPEKGENATAFGEFPRTSA